MSAKAARDDPWLTLDEVAAMLRRKRKTLLNWRYQGTGPPWVQLGGERGELLVQSSALAKWLSEQQPKGA